MIKSEKLTKQEEFKKDLDARRSWHKVMNYHYLSYKGISILNQKYSREVLEGFGLSIHVPRTFMTIETIRPDLERPLDVKVSWRSRKEKSQAEKTEKMLKGEWQRSKSDKQKAKAEFDALLFGSGYLLNYFEIDKKIADVLTGYDNEGRPKYEKSIQKNYEGMRVKWLNPYYVIPDRKAKTYDPNKHDSPRRIWVVSIWDFDKWLAECKEKGYKTEGLVPGGQIEELDSVKRTIDSIYTKTLSSYKTRDGSGQLISEDPNNISKSLDNENSIGVIYEYTDKEINIYAGQNWTECDSSKLQFPKKEIPIYVLKDYDIPGELEGVGEAEVMRWQQYEENKIHNLMYLQVILNTVRRYGVVEELLQDPTQLRHNRILEPLRLKYMPGIKISDAISTYDQASSNDVPLNVLNEIKTIGQMATGQSDYNIGANEGEAGTLGEAEMMNVAGTKRVKQKIQQMEEGGITPILESWKSAIPFLYTDELDYLINDGTNRSVKFLPFHRSYNRNAKLVAEYSIKEGVPTATTLEEVFILVGYDDVVFVSDLVGDYDISVKTSLALLDRHNIIRQYQGAIEEARKANQDLMARGQPPKWDTAKLTEELLRQFSDIIDDIEEYKLPEQLSEQPASNQQPLNQSMPQEEEEDIPIVEETISNINI